MASAVHFLFYVKGKEKEMKKILTLIMSAILLFSFVACSKDKSKIPSEEKHDYLVEGTQLYAEGNYESAIDSFTKAIDEKPEYAPAYMHRGESYLAKSEQDINILALAKADFEKAIELDSTLIHAKKCIAFILYLEKDIEGSKAIMQQVLSLDIVPTYTVILFIIDGTYCHDCGDFEHTVHPDYIDLAKNSYTDGDYDGAILYFTQRINEAPEHAPAYMHRGESYLAKGIDDINILALAKADFEKALELDSTLIHAKECLAYIFYLQGNSDEARKLILEVLSVINTENSYTLILLIINNKYCHECGRFEHTEHPDIWLTDMSDEEIIEISDDYVELYYNCAMYGIQDRYKYHNSNLDFGNYGTLGEDGTRSLKYTIFQNTKTNELEIVEGLLQMWGAGFKLGDFSFDGKSKETSGELYNIKGENITNLVRNFSILEYQAAYKVGNFKSISEIQENYKKHFSYRISEKIDYEFVNDVKDGLFVEYNGSLFVRNDKIHLRPSCIDLNSATIISRTENSFIVKYKHDYMEFNITPSESTWTFGVENNRLVLLDYSEKGRKYE